MDNTYKCNECGAKSAGTLSIHTANEEKGIPKQENNEKNIFITFHRMDGTERAKFDNLKDAILFSKALTKDSYFFSFK